MLNMGLQRPDLLGKPMSLLILGSVHRYPNIGSPPLLLWTLIVLSSLSLALVARLSTVSGPEMRLMCILAL